MKAGGRMEYTLFLDTNALLNLQSNAFKEKFVISQKTLEEVESIKSSGLKDGEIKYKARKCAHLLDEKYNEYKVRITDESVFDVIKEFSLQATPDTIILASAYIWNKEVEPIIFVSDDINVKCLAREVFGFITKGVNEINIVKRTDEYKGYQEIKLNDDDMSDFYTNINENKYDCLLNEYLIIKNESDEIVDYRRWNGQTHVALNYKQINSKFVGKIKPRNPQQVIAFDMLQNKDETIKVLSGRFGSGKDFLMISNALELIKNGKYDRIVWVRNSIQVSDVKDIGFLPGTMHDKLKPFSMVLADHLGGEEGLDLQILSGTIVIEHLGFVRGRDYKNSIIMCTESENMTKEHIQLLIGRVGEGSALWLNGDFKQTDSGIFRINNGLMSAIDKLKGHEKFGFVKLEKTERSETAALADLLD